MPAQQQTSLPAPESFVALIDRALRDPTVDVDKLQHLLDLREIETNRFAEKAFTSALVLAQGEMESINADANNPQTRSKYATYAALDRVCRPIYKKYWLAPTFNTEQTSDLNIIMVTALLGHRDGHRQRYQIPMPIITQGFKGTDMMTRTHATGSAFSYGRRYLLIGMFNLAIDHDDDGGIRRAPQIRRDMKPMQHTYDEATETIDPHTGEVEHTDPHMIEMTEGSTWAQFLEPLQRAILQANTVDEIDQWMLMNQTLLLKLKENKPQLFRLFEKNIEPKKLELANP
jgi:hypothetical protein